MRKGKIINISGLPKVTKNDAKSFMDSITAVKFGDCMSYNPRHYSIKINKDGWITMSRRKKGNRP